MSDHRTVKYLSKLHKGICSRMCSGPQGVYKRSKRCVRPSPRGYGRFLWCVVEHSTYLCGTETVCGCSADGELIYGPRREKSCLWGIRQSEFQTGLLSYRDYLENRNFTCSKFTFDTFHKVNNKGADQTARMSRLVCPCVFRKLLKTGFLASRSIWQ